MKSNTNIYQEQDLNKIKSKGWKLSYRFRFVYFSNYNYIMNTTKVHNIWKRGENQKFS